MLKFRYLLLLILGFSLQAGISQTIEQHIQSSSDDAEEKHDGSFVALSSSDIELMYDSWNDQMIQTVGLRFTNIEIPENSSIKNAYIQFTADGSSSGNVTLNIKGEDSANSVSFSNSDNNISSRASTTANVTWSLTSSWSDNQSGSAQRTPDLSKIITEVISSNGWKSGNPISFIITGTGGEDNHREAVSFDESPSKSAKLVIEYSSNFNVDLALTSILSPANFTYPTPEAFVQVELSNFGKLDADNYELILSVDSEIITIEQGNTSLEQGENTLFTFAKSIDLTSIGTKQISVELKIDDDENLSNNNLTKTITILNEIDQELVIQGSSWRFWDSSNNPGFNWQSINYEDNEWPVGLGQFGFGDGDEVTKLKPGLTSYYFRKKINISDISQYENIYMHLIHDDAAIVYINGQEAFRTELMPLGSINHLTEARQECNDNNENEFYTYKLNIDLFVNGINTIAISTRNENSGNSSFDCYLSSSFEYDQDGPYVFYEGDNIIVEEITPTGVISNSYLQGDEIELTCTLPHMNTSFSFPLKKEITTEPSIYSSTPPKFLSISDFDGHIEAFTMLLRGEGIIDENFNWTYGNGHLIISGDLFDRGFHITECLWLLYKLEAEAEAQGGKVHLIIGNHEIFNLTDDWRYVEVKYFNNAHLLGKRMLELYDNNTELGRWLRSKNILEKIGKYAFMHGGISPQVAGLNLSYEEINNYGRLEMEGSCFGLNCVTVNGSKGIYWYRDMAREELTQEQVDEIVNAFDVERIIIGHTKDATVRSLYNGKVIAIDMYHVTNFENGFMEALQFELGCFYIFHTETNINNNSYTLLDDCDDFTNTIEINTKGHMQIFPNPTASALNIKLPPEMKTPTDYSIVSADGKILSQGIITSEFTNVSLSHLKAGKYFLILQNETSRITGSFVLIE